MGCLQFKQYSDDIQYSRVFQMNENPNNPKPSDQSTLKCKLALSQSRIQQSFKQPSRLLPAFLTLLTYVQCLKYPIDTYSTYWFNTNTLIFSYFDLSYYTPGFASFICSSISLLYCLFSFLLILWQKRINHRVVLSVAKVCQMGFSTIFFMAIVGDNCHTIANYFKSPAESKVGMLALAFLSITFFIITICLQTFTRFDFILKNNKMNGIIRLSNWSSVTLLVYIVINQLTVHFADLTTPTHLIIMIISIGFHTFILLIKAEHEEQTPFRMELCLLAINILSIIILLCLVILKLKLDIGLLIILSIMSVIAISKIDYFNIVFELQNVNKWTTSQIMIAYAAKLRKILLNYDDYYFNIIFLGYVEIHQQKCDNEACPLRNIGTEDQAKKLRFEDIIKKIYNDGCKLSPVNPELLLEYSIFYYESGAHDKSMKTLLDIKENELTLDKYCKYVRLKNMIYRETSEIPSKDFLDLLSEIKVKDIEDKILKKFQQSALISLEFWSILNEDHPNFRKLYEIGKSKVMIGQKVHEHYKQINKIAHSQRITALYIHYLNLIENEQKMYSEVEGQIRNEEGFDNKIVIEDWSNNCNPIIIVSAEEDNFGSIIDLNTTCATILGHEKFDMVGRDIKSIFPGVLVRQMDKFMSVNQPIRGEQYFYVGQNSGYCLKIKRKLQHYNSIETGLSLIVTIENKFLANSGFLIFNNENQLVSLSSSCLQLLDLEENILENETFYSDLLEISVSELGEEKKTVLLETFLKSERVKRYGIDSLDVRHLQRIFNVEKKEYGQFFVVYFVLLKNSKNLQLQNQSIAMLQKTMQDTHFEFSVGFQQNEFLFLGSFANKFKFPNIELTLTHNLESAKEVAGQKRNYAEQITTLRLHENYIKVIEESSSQNSDGQKQSQTSTNNELLAKAQNIPKADEEKIFQSRETYHEFVDKNSKKVHVRLSLAISIIVCLGVYIGVYFSIKDNYNSIRTMYYRFALGNRMIGDMAEANRIVLQTKYYTAIPSKDTEWLLLQNYNKTLQRLQEIAKNYTLPYPIQVYIDENKLHQFRSDQFLLAFISEFSKIKAAVFSANLSNYTLDSDSSRFVELNGNLTRQRMIPHTNNFKQKCKNKSITARNFLIIVSGCGLVLSLILTLLTMITLKKLNQYKVQLLSVFLQTTEKDIQNFSEKTQNFLVTLHVDQSNQNNQPVEQLFENKKNSPIMFAKKKRFKSTQFRKAPYIVLASFFLFSSAYFIHLLAFTIQKNIFIVDAVQYFDVVSAYGNVLATSQARIYKELNDKAPFVQTNISISNLTLSGQINTQILEYERQFFTWHYQTYGTMEDYHQKFATVFMKDICKGEIKIKYACNAGSMAENGTILMLTDFTIQNTQIDYAKPLDPMHFITAEAIKQAHLYLLNEVMTVSDTFFDEINTNILQILLIWVISLIIFGIFLQLYVDKVIMKDAYLVRCMLKFFPVSFARNSEGINNFISTVIEQGPV